MADTRVRWNNAEKATLTTHALELIRAEGVSPLEALRRAQEALPASRRRVLRHMGEAPFLKQALKGVTSRAPKTAAGAPTRAAASTSGMPRGAGGSFRESLVDFFAGVIGEALQRSLALVQTAVFPAAPNGIMPVRRTYRRRAASKHNAARSAPVKRGRKGAKATKRASRNA